MTLTTTAVQRSHIAFNRFGLGARPGGPGRIGADPKAAVLAELATPDIALIDDPTLPSYGEAARIGQSGFQPAEDLRTREMLARVDKQRSVEIGFVERLVAFWSNHFSMSSQKNETVRATYGQLERDVIRRHVLGRFSDMLLGVIRHPAMIVYLDNQNSKGPTSPTGRETGDGLNENLAREILELHTLGSGGGYTEGDVTALARILTGWSFVESWQVDFKYFGATKANMGRYIWRAPWHEPGTIRLRGKAYPPLGEGQARAVLRDLARAPATAEHIAFKLVRHFITDTPSPAQVKPLKDAFLATGGDLKAVALALLDLPDAWTAPLAKIRTPYEGYIAQYRALGARFANDDPWALYGPLISLNQMLWECPSPEGYSDETPTWMNPDAMTIRLDTALMTASSLGPKSRRDPVPLARLLFGPALSSVSRARIAAAAARGRTEGFTVLFMIPEFLRR